MMNRIMKTGVTAAALAASALLATPATAQTATLDQRSVSAVELRGGSGFGDSVIRQVNRDRTGLRQRRGPVQPINHGRRYHNNHLNEYGQSPREVQYLVDQAIYECDCQLKVDARKYGYAGADLRRPRVKQIGPRKFAVYARAKLFDGYDYSRQPYECLVRRGSIRRATDLYPVRYSSHHRDGYRRGGFSFTFGSRY